MRKTIYSILFALILLNTLRGQEDPFKSVTLKTPEEASIYKYSEIPMSLYTGVPNISIPLYEIKFKRINVPIILNYHSSGILVEDEGDWVGLNWNLNAGGIVSREIRGQADNISTHGCGGYDYNRHLITTNLAERDFGLNYPYEYYRAADYSAALGPGYCGNLSENHHSCFFLDGATDPDFTETVANFVSADMEPDIYHFSFSDYSGEFAIDKYGKAHVLKNKDKLMVEIITSGILITASNGVSYFFKKLQSGISIPDVGQGAKDIWHLKNIIDGPDTLLTYNYAVSSTYDLKTFPSYSYRSMQGQITNSTTSLSCISYNSCYLKEILFANGKIRFTREDRSDIQNAKRLKTIEVLNVYATSEVLIKKYVFKYSYYSPITTSYSYDNFISQHSSFSGYAINHNRLKLDSIRETICGEKHIFQYNATSLPCKSSFSKDHWGYYNGAANSGLVPSSEISREANSVYSKTGILEKITYPTGGNSKFYFESNTYSNLNDDERYDTTYTRIGAIYGSYTARGDFSLIGTTDVNFEAVATCTICSDGTIINFYIKDSVTNQIVKTFSGTIISHGVRASAVFTLPAGHYYMATSYNAQSGTSQIEIWAEIPESITEYTYRLGGGLRIRRIDNFDPISNKTMINSYDYSSDDSPSSGILFIKPLYVNRFQICPSESYHITVTSSNSIRALQSTTKIGYSKVEHYLGTKSDNNGFERTYFYNNSYDYNGTAEFIAYTDCNAYPYFKMLKVYINENEINGNIQTQYIYDNKGVLIRSLEESWTGKYLGCVPGFISLSYIFTYATTYQYIDILAYGNKIILPVVESRIVNEYFGSNTLVNETYYYYNEADPYYSLSKTIDYTSKSNEILETRYRYPYDINYGIYTTMLNRHMISYPIEEINLRNNKVISGKLTTYKEYISSHIAPETYRQIETTTPLSSFTNFNGVTYDTHYGNPDVYKYDKYYNLKENKKTGDIPTSYYWSYNNIYPVVRAVNCDTTTLSSKVIQSLPIGFTTMEGLLKSIVSFPNSNWTTFNNNIRKNASTVMVTTYTYKPLVGITSETDPSGKTSYYIYDSAGRLQYILDRDGNIIQEYKYHYKE